MSSRNGREDLDVCNAGCAGSSPSMNGENIEGSADGKGCTVVNFLSSDMADISIGSTHEVEREVMKEESGAAPEPCGYSITTNAEGHLEEVQRQAPAADSGNRKKSGSFCAQNNNSQWSWEPQTDWSLENKNSQCAQNNNNEFEPSNISTQSEEEVISSVFSQEESVSIYDSKFDTSSHQSDVGDDESLEDPDDDMSDDYDSDSSHESHEMQKKNRWFRVFFEAMDSLAVGQVNELNRRWHCPACHDGPGAIAWYRGLQPLISHAKTKGSSRVKLHRKFAELVEGELQRRKISVRPYDEASSQLKGLPEPTTVHEIVWPPMVIIMNNLLKKDDNGKWLGMGNQELCEYFSEYAVVKARHSYGPRGYEGTSVLIFEDSAIGYWEAERLHKHFLFSGRDRDAWGRCQMLCPGAECQLYGYLACKLDIDIFNQHLQGKFRLKFEIRSYQQMVVVPMKRMSEDSQTLIQIKKKVAKLQDCIYNFEELLLVSRAMHMKIEGEIRMLTKCREEMDTQELLLKKQDDSDVKAMEKLEELNEWEQTNLDPVNNKANSQRDDSVIH